MYTCQTECKIDREGCEREMSSSIYSRRCLKLRAFYDEFKPIILDNFVRTVLF